MQTRVHAKQAHTLHAGRILMESEDAGFLSASVALSMGLMIAAWQDMAAVLRTCRDVSYDILADLAEDIARCLEQLQAIGR